MEQDAPGDVCTLIMAFWPAETGDVSEAILAAPVFSMLNVTATALALFTLVVIDHSASVTSTVPDEGPVGTVSVLSEAAFPPESSSRDAADGVFARPVADAMPIAEPVTAIAT